MGDGGDGGSKDKYESHTQVGDLTIIFADTRVVLVKRRKASSDRKGKKKYHNYVRSIWVMVGIYGSNVCEYCGDLSIRAHKMGRGRGD